MVAGLMGFRKAFKKNKLIRVVLAQHLRRFLLILKFSQLQCIVNSTTNGLPFFFKFLLTPITKPFLNPFTGYVWDDEKRPDLGPRFEYLFLRKSEPWSV